jgi:hypothetical protein
LLPLLDWISGRPHEGYRRLEQKVSSETATRLRATTATLQPEALYAALQAEIALYGELRMTIFDRYSLDLNAANTDPVC